MRIVDAQIHLWGSGLPSNMAHRQVTSFTTEEAVGLMDEGGVDAAVIHPPGWDPKSTEMAFKAVRDFPGRFAILGAFPLSSPDKRALVETWRSQPGMLGLRYGFLRGRSRWSAHRAPEPLRPLHAAAPETHCRQHQRRGRGSRHEHRAGDRSADRGRHGAFR
jgi:predicted TIM-barrel fold metal-dependent hydrolase